MVNEIEKLGTDLKINSGFKSNYHRVGIFFKKVDTIPYFYSPSTRYFQFTDQLFASQRLK